MKKPLIGLTASHNLKNGESYMSPHYLKAVSESGGIPLILPLIMGPGDMEQLVGELDGFLFTGGPDVHPFLFGEETLMGCGDFSPLRDTLEMTLLPLILRKKKPLLAICRGMQLINIALGGDIYQDISSQLADRLPIAHRQPFSAASPSHHVTLEKGSKLASLCGTLTLSVNSAHHQAVRTVAPCLRACAQAPDGIVEAWELPEHPFFVGVQWHPELLFPTESHARLLFKAFVASCKDQAQGCLPV